MWLFKKPSVTPILTIAQKIAQGDFSARVPVNGIDEMGQLGQAINSMAEQLQSLQKDLDTKVTERTALLRNNVQELEQATAKMETILANIADGIIVTNENGIVVLVNRATEELLGLTIIHIINKNISDIFPLYNEDDTSVVQENRPLSITLRTKSKSSQSFHFMVKDGRKLVINLTATPIIQSGKVIGGVELIRDITKEKEVDRMKTEFISLASHQLRTPLSAIKWFTEMLLNGDAGQLNPEQIDFAKNVSESTERMIQLVNSLLNISRIESGRIIVDPQPTDLKELLDGVVVDLKGKIEEKKQNLLVNVHSDLPKISIDPRLVRQVFLNLLTNAIKYTPKEGEITVFVSKKDNDVICQVTDNGYGIPKHQQEKVFQKFFRAENIAKVETDGTGLGLYLVKSIIESSNGRIWFESPAYVEKTSAGKEEGKGTSFWFSLPLTGMQARAGEVTLD